MNRYFVAILTYGILLSASELRADIPFTESTGVLTYTKDEYKKISPFWGIVAINGDLLPYLRFFGNNKDIKRGDQEVEQGRDDIAELIRQLFRSPDGIQFVATTYWFDLAGDLSRHLDKINDIIQILVEPEAQKVNKNQDEISRLSALIKTKKSELSEISSLLKEVRDEFFEEKKKFETQSQIIGTEIKSITEKIKKLNTPDPRIKEKGDFLAKIRSLESKNIKNADPTLQTQIIDFQKKVAAIETALEQEQGVSKLDRLSQVLDSISSLREATDEMVMGEARAILRKKASIPQVASAVKAQQQQAQREDVGLQYEVDWAESLQAAAEEMLANAPERAIALVENKNVEFSTPAEAKKFLSELYKDKIRQFAQLLLNAYETQKELANPEKADQQLYPENMVVISLLAFFAKNADSKEALKKLPFLMKKGDELYRLPAFTKDDYKKIKISKDIVVTDPETAFLYSRGYSVFQDNIIPTFVYRGSTTYDGKEFPDCGESSLRYVLMALLSAGNGGKITSDDMELLESKLEEYNPDIDLRQHKGFQNFKVYVLNNGELNNISAQTMHDQWANIVSNLNDSTMPQTFNDVQYGREPVGNGSNTYEIKSNYTNVHLGNAVRGIVNMFNVIGKLIPDKELNEPWSENRKERFEQVEMKLDRFCDLFSKKNIEINWENSPINNELMVLNLTVNDKPAISWHFEDGHFYPEKLSTIESDPRVAFNTNLNFTNEWVGSMYLKYNRNWDKINVLPQNILPLLFSKGLRETNDCNPRLFFVLNKYPRFLTVIPRWIKISFPANDPYPIGLFSFFMNQFLSIEAKIPDFNNLKAQLTPFYKRFKALGGETVLTQAIKSGHERVLQDLINSGADIKGGSLNGLPLIFLVDSPVILDMLIKAGADVNEPTYVTGKRTYFIFKTLLRPASSKIDFLKKEIQLGADVNVLNDVGSSFFSTFLNQLDFSHPENFDLYKEMLNHGANVNGDKVLPFVQFMKNKNLPEGATEGGWLDILNDLLDKCDLKAVDQDQSTLLHHAVELNRLDFVERLLKKGVDVNAKNNKGNEPINLAVENQNIAKLLVDNGANINNKNLKGQTILFTNNKRNTWVESIRFNRGIKNYWYDYPDLIKLGANPNIQDNEGNTYLHVALPFVVAQARDLTTVDDFIDIFVKSGGNPHIINKLGKEAAELTKAPIPIRNAIERACKKNPENNCHKES